MEPSLEFWNRILPVEARQAGYVGASFTMVAALPLECERATVPSVQIACLESWFVHMRLLIEFFGLRNGKGNPRDFAASTLLLEAEQDPELETLWVMASQQVVHFSSARTPERFEDLRPFDVSPENLQRLARKMLTIAERFVETLGKGDPAIASAYRIALDEAWNHLDMGCRRSPGARC